MKAREKGAAALRLRKPEWAAEQLEVTVETLEKWRAQHIGPPFYRLSSRLIRYSVRDIEDYKKRHRITTKRK